jgi:hypothetical protein
MVSGSQHRSCISLLTGVQLTHPALAPVSRPSRPTLAHPSVPPCGKLVWHPPSLVVGYDGLWHTLTHTHLDAGPTEHQLTVAVILSTQLHRNTTQVRRSHRCPAADSVNQHSSAHVTAQQRRKKGLEVTMSTDKQSGERFSIILNAFTAVCRPQRTLQDYVIMTLILLICL